MESLNFHSGVQLHLPKISFGRGPVGTDVGLPLTGGVVPWPPLRTAAAGFDNVEADFL